MVFLCTLAHSATYEYLAFNLADGTAKALSANGVKITYADGNLLAQNATETLTLALADVASMQFTNTLPTGISTLLGAGDTITARNGVVSVTTKQACKVCIYDAAGRMVESFATVAGTASQSRKLTKGCYVVKMGKASYKVML